jgi:hypothetical protein
MAEDTQQSTARTEDMMAAVKSFLYLITYHAITMNGGVQVQLHHSCP